MCEPSELDMERRINALLCGELAGSQQRELLSAIVHDEAARKLLGEMLDVQSQARAAFGYDRAEEQIGASFRRLSASIEKGSTTTNGQSVFL